jgi:hypothetical protein
VREVVMAMWNDFWRVAVPGLRPTKGYPQDAARFKREIETKQQELGIPDEWIWRIR